MKGFDLIENNSKKYKNIAESRLSNFAEINDALEIVKQFIIDKKLLIYGGMSIDINLKIAGHPGIYSDDAIPDYDILSPDFYNDSNELAVILYNSGFKNVSSINAIHYSTRHIRVNFISVCDISYMPQNIYDSIPYIVITPKKYKQSVIFENYKNLRIVHPDFQRLDLHRAFNILYSHPPQEVILNRFEKDQKRFRLIDEYFPINIEKNTLKKEKIYKLEILKDIYKNSLMSGIVAYTILLDLLKRFIKKYNKKIDFEIIDISIEFQNEKFIISMDYNFKDCLITILTDSFQEKVDTIQNAYQKEKKSSVSYYERYLDNIRPKMAIIDNIEILDFKNELVPCYNLNKIYKFFDIEMDEILIAHPNYHLLYFLQKSFEFSKQADIYRSLYKSMLIIVEKIEIIYTLNEPELEKIYHDIPFFVSPQTYGTKNESIDHMIMMTEKRYIIDNVPFENRKIMRSNFGYYPPGQWPEFDINKAELFQISGKKII